MTKVTVRLKETLFQELQEKADDEGTNKSAYLRQLIKDDVGRPTLKDRIRSLEDRVGRIESNYFAWIGAFYDKFEELYEKDVIDSKPEVVSVQRAEMVEVSEEDDE